MEEFLNLSEDSLIKILSYLSLDELGRFCSSNPQINNICNQDFLWQAKSFQDYGERAKNKPREVNWKEWYQLLMLKKIPLYFNGDRIAWVPFSYDFLALILKLIQPKLKNIVTDQQLNVVFIDEMINPVLIVKYPQMDYIVKSKDWDSIEKIVLIANDNFEAKHIEELDSQEMTDQQDLQNIDDQQDRLIIHEELVSFKGNPPIYGRNYSIIRQNRFADGAPEIIYKFLIVHRTSEHKAPIWKDCRIFDLDKLVEIASDLRLDPDEIRESLVNQQKTNLCNLIKERLIEIGHVL